MREPIKHAVALLVTDDTAVENAVRKEAAGTGEAIELLRGEREALSLLIDGCGEERFAVVDLEAACGGRRLLETASGALPVIAITDRARPWLSSLLRRHRIGAIVVKPVTGPKVREAWERVHGLQARVGRSWN